jgi:hypothetical protein
MEASGMEARLASFARNLHTLIVDGSVAIGTRTVSIGHACGAGF